MTAHHHNREARQDRSQNPLGKFKFGRNFSFCGLPNRRPSIRFRPADSSNPAYPMILPSRTNLEGNRSENSLPPRFGRAYNNKRTRNRGDSSPKTIPFEADNSVRKRSNRRLLRIFSGFVKTKPARIVHWFRWTSRLPGFCWKIAILGVIFDRESPFQKSSQFRNFSTCNRALILPQP